MSEHYDFHYQPTGSGAISGQQVLEQTEDAINELGDYVNDNVGGAMDVAQQALETAQNAEQDAQTALDTANSFSSAIQSAQQDASTALSTAQTAQTTASNANNTAIQASQDASSAVTTANNASGQVSTLSGTVTALGQRVTTAEGNIGQNASDITALTTRVGTAEGNITTLQNDVSIAQGNASSAMATAGTVKQQAYVFRYSSTALVASSTNSNTLLDNTDNLKVGDKVIDSDGVLFSITAIDSVNSTFTIGSALIDLALDANVVHTSGNENVGGIKNFSDDTFIKSLNFTNEVASTSSSSSSIMPIITTITYSDSSPSVQARLNLRVTADGVKSLYPHENMAYSLGLVSRIWSDFYTYHGYFRGQQQNDEFSGNARTNLTLLSNRDAVGQSGCVVDTFRENTAQGTGSHIIGFGIKENSVRYEGCRFSWGWDNDLNGYSFSIRPTLQGTNQAVEHSLGSSTAKWDSVYSLKYYYGSSDTEFSDKFVTTDTAQDISANKNFKGLITTQPDSPLWGNTNNTTADITSLAVNCIHIESRTAGSLSDLSGGAWYVAQIGTGCFFFRQNTGTDVRYKHFPTNVVSKVCLMSNDNKFISDLCPDTTNSYNLGDSTNKWSTINGLEPSALGMPDLSNGIDISSYITVVSGGNAQSTYTPSVNGWISIALSKSSGAHGIQILQGNFGSSGHQITDVDGNVKCLASMPVKANVAVTINSALNETVVWAYFYPCLGNV